MEFETKRLILRPWKESDAKDLYQYAKSPKVGPITGWNPHQSVEESREIIEKFLCGAQDYAIVFKETGQAIGSVSLMIGKAAHLDLPESEAEIGCWIGVPFWGRGLMKEAIETLFDYAFHDLNLNTIWAGYFEGNERSRRLQEKCGLHYVYTLHNVPCAIEGLLRTEQVLCIEKVEWLASKS